MKTNNLNNNDNHSLENKNKIEEKDHIKYNFNEDLSSPQLIQAILHVDNLNKKTGIVKMQNKIIEKCTSINDLVITTLENNNRDNVFNPFIELSKQKQNLSKLNFNESNINQKELDNRIQQYVELQQKLLKNINKNSNQNEQDNDLVEKLYIVNHPSIKLCEKEININEVKNNINIQYQNKFKNNTNANNNSNLSTEILTNVNNGGELTENNNTNLSLEEILDDNNNINIISYSSNNSNDNENNSIIDYSSDNSNDDDNNPLLDN